MFNFTVVLVMLVSTLGPAAIIGLVGYAAIMALGRNPSAAPKILLAMITAFIFAESIAVVAILMVYNIFK